MTRRTHSPADDARHIEKLLRPKVDAIRPRPGFKDQLYQNLMQDMYSSRLAKDTHHGWFPLLWLKGPIAAVAVMSILGTTVGLTGYSYASSEVTRESRLYFLKQMAESLELTIASPTPEQYAKTLLKFADRRLAEAEYLSGQGVLDLQTTHDVVSNLEQVMQTIDQVSAEAAKEELREGIRNISRLEREHIGKLMSTLEVDIPPPPSLASSDGGTASGVTDVSEHVPSRAPVPMTTEPKRALESLAATAEKLRVIDAAVDVEILPPPEPIPAPEPIEEIRTESSSSVSPVSIRPTRGAADLTVHVNPGAFAVGTDGSITITVTNSGDSDAESFEVSVDWGDGERTSEVMNGVAIGATETVRMYHVYASVGQHLIVAVANSNRGVRESNENNNMQRVGVFVEESGGQIVPQPKPVPIRRPSSAASSVASERQSSTRCTDSDGGAEIFEAGHITLDSNTMKDFCDGERLNEAVCEGTNGSYSIYRCLNGCQAGACKPY